MTCGRARDDAQTYDTAQAVRDERWRLLSREPDDDGHVHAMNSVDPVAVAFLTAMPTGPRRQKELSTVCVILTANAAPPMSNATPTARQTSNRTC